MDFKKNWKCEEEKWNLLLEQPEQWIFDAAAVLYWMIQAAVFTKFCAGWLKAYFFPGKEMLFLCSISLALGVWAAGLYGKKRHDLDVNRNFAKKSWSKKATAAISAPLCTELLLLSERNGIHAADIAFFDSQMPEMVLMQWNILLLLLCLIGIFINIAWALWCIREKIHSVLKQSSGSQTQKHKWSAELLWAGGILLADRIAAGFSDAFCALCYYQAMNLQILLPLLLGFWIYQKRKQKDAAAQLCRNVIRKAKIR